jgi:hypothetical protein
VGKEKSSDEKVQAKGKRGAKGKQAEVANQDTKEDFPAKNGETKNEELAASDDAEENEAMADNRTPSLTRAPRPLLVHPQVYFYQLVCKCKFFSSSRNIF